MCWAYSVSLKTSKLARYKCKFAEIFIFQYLLDATLFMVNSYVQVLTDSYSVPTIGNLPRPSVRWLAALGTCATCHMPHYP